jgi:hypothetical protein
LEHSSTQWSCTAVNLTSVYIWTSIYRLLHMTFLAVDMTRPAIKFELIHEVILICAVPSTLDYMPSKEVIVYRSTTIIPPLDKLRNDDHDFKWNSFRTYVTVMCQLWMHTGDMDSELWYITMTINHHIELFSKLFTFFMIQEV